MSSFEVKALADKLGKLSNSQQSIETLSNYIVYHRKRAKIVVQTWEAEFAKTSSSSERRLTLIHLANDVLQRSRKLGPEFVNEFFKVMPRAFRHLSKHADSKTKTRMHRLIDIWEERKVFGHHVPKSIRDAMDSKDDESNKSPKSSKQDSELVGPDAALVSALKTLESAQALESRASHVAMAAVTSEVKSEAAMMRGLDAGRAPQVEEQLSKATQALQQHHQALQASLTAQETLIAILKQHLHTQEEQFEATEGKLQEVRDQSDSLEKLKMKKAQAMERLGDAAIPVDDKTLSDDEAEVNREEGTPEVELYDPLAADAGGSSDAQDVASSLANMDNPAALLRDALTGMSQDELNLFGSSLAQLAASSSSEQQPPAPQAPHPGMYQEAPQPGQQVVDMDVGNESPFKRQRYEELPSAPAGYPPGYSDPNVMRGPPGFC